MKRDGGTIDTLKIARCGYSHKLYVVNQMLFVDNVSFSTTGFSFLQSNCMDEPDDTFAIQFDYNKDTHVLNFITNRKILIL